MQWHINELRKIIIKKAKKDEKAYNLPLKA